MVNRSKLDYGLAGEEKVTAFLQSRGVSVGQAPETLSAAFFRGPRVDFYGVPLVAPDRMAWANGAPAWLEIKRKSRWSWWERGGYPVTGIDLPKYEQYLAIAQMGDIPLWVLFVQHNGPMGPGLGPGPTGLYGQNVLVLAAHENHRHENGGDHGMVYWRESALVRLNDLYASDFAALFRGETRGPLQPGIPALRRPKNV
jgi:hypothetical protein